jgi:hypothetical protein
MEVSRPATGTGESGAIGLLGSDHCVDMTNGGIFTAVIARDEPLMAAAVNNYAICSLYLRRIPIAISRLEGLIQQNPTRYLTDPVVFNLCTLYDLSSSPEVSVIKKKVLQQVAIRFHVDDPILNWRSFRLN